MQGSFVVLALLAAGASTRRGRHAFTESIKRYDVDLTIEPAGTLLVRETIDYDFGPVPHHGIFRDIRTRVDYDAEGELRPRVPDRRDLGAVRPRARRRSTASRPKATTSASRSVTPTARSPGSTSTRSRTGCAARSTASRTTTSWCGTSVGVEWPVPIAAVNVTVHAPAEITGVNCSQGPFGSFQACGTATATGDTATFTAAEVFAGLALGPFEGMTVTVGIPKGAVVPEPKPILEERFTVTSAFRVTPATGGLAVAMLIFLVAIVLGLVWFFGRDRRYQGSAVDVAFGSDVPNAPEERVPLFGEHETPVEFVPPDGLRPGQVGTLVDFKANPLDVTATIVDLAVRGYLKIEELSEAGLLRKGDWKLTRMKEDDAELMPYEQQLLDGLFRDDPEVQLSDLRYTFAARMTDGAHRAQDDAKQRGWFAGTLERCGSCAFAGLGFLVLVIGVGLTVALALLDPRRPRSGYR